jgi:hypothetical protein
VNGWDDPEALSFIHAQDTKTPRRYDAARSLSWRARDGRSV